MFWRCKNGTDILYHHSEFGGRCRKSRKISMLYVFFLKLTFTLLNGRVCELDFCSKHLNSETTLMSLDIWECCIAVCAPAFNIISASQNGATTE